jgi:predicted AlkP superfamily phosphohydrolase/phosphomutase
LNVSAKVLILGFDALEVTLVDRWIAEGHLPTFAGLSAHATTCPLGSNVEYLSDTFWPELTTGRAATAAGWYWQPEQVHVGEERLRANTPDDFDTTGFWVHASAAGRSVAVLDVVYAAPAPPGLHGVLLRDWGTHSAGFGRGSDPPAYLDEIIRRYGEYPLPHGWAEDEGRAWGCDIHDGSRASLEELPRKLAEAVELKTRVILGELEREDWDLFFAVLHEGHCAGHQLWHFLDESSPWYEPDAPAALKNGVRDVYSGLDESLARILDRVDDDTAVLVLLSRGMTSYVGGWQLLPEILVRLGYSSAGHMAESVRSRLPAPARKAIKAVVRGRLRDRIKSAAGTPAQPLEHPRTKAARVRCGRTGGIRLNVKGRDPVGSVEPGTEYDAICADLSRELKALRDADTGEAVVLDVVRSDTLFSGAYHPNLPDLIVKFREHGEITSVTSPRVGTVTEPARDRLFPRSGEHTPNARLWATGRGIPSGATIEGAHVLDVGPTVLGLLGVPAPPALDGKALHLRDPVPA